MGAQAQRPLNSFPRQGGRWRLTNPKHPEPGPPVCSVVTKQAVEPSIYIWLMPRHVRWHRARVGLVVALIIIFVGVMIDSLFSASWALDDGLLLAAAAVIALALLLTRGRGRADAS